MPVSDEKLEAMAQAIAEALDPEWGTPMGWWLVAAPHFKRKCRQAARNVLAVMEKSEL